MLSKRDKPSIDSFNSLAEPIEDSKTIIKKENNSVWNKGRFRLQRHNKHI